MNRTNLPNKGVFNLTFFETTALNLYSSHVAQLHPKASECAAKFKAEGFRDDVAKDKAAKVFFQEIVLKNPYEALKELANNASEGSLFINSIAAVFTGWIHTSPQLDEAKSALFDQLKCFRDEVLNSNIALRDLNFTNPGVANRIARDLDIFFTLRAQSPR